MKLDQVTPLVLTFLRASEMRSKRKKSGVSSFSSVNTRWKCAKYKSKKKNWQDSVMMSDERRNICASERNNGKSNSKRNTTK